MAEIAQENPNRWQGLYEYKDMINRAVLKCQEIAEGEKLMGYTESCRAYKDMTNEIQATWTWLTRIMP